MTMRAAFLKRTQRLVIKVGSAVIANDEGLDLARLQTLSTEICALRQQGFEVLMVSSGAVAAGKRDLNIQGRPTSIQLKQAAAAVGQSRMMRFYREAFRDQGQNVAQILLTRDDLANRRRYLNARNTLMTLLDFGIVPIINENDSVVVDEIRFGDNDNLSALVAGLAEAQLLVILSDVDGLYDKDPGSHPLAQRIPVVERISDTILRMAGNKTTKIGTGGMQSKLKAARKAAQAGIASSIINGRQQGNLRRLLTAEEIGTFILPAGSPMAAKKHWIVHTKKPKGRIYCDTGACRALEEHGKSLLPSGINGVDGGFERGDTVRLCDSQGQEFAVGVINYALSELLQIMGQKSSVISNILGYTYGDEVVHRDNLVLHQEASTEGDSSL